MRSTRRSDWVSQIAALSAVVTNRVVPRLWRRIYRVSPCMAADYRGGLPPQPSSKLGVMDAGKPARTMAAESGDPSSTQLTCCGVAAIADDRCFPCLAVWTGAHWRGPHEDHVWR